MEKEKVRKREKKREKRERERKVSGGEKKTKHEWVEGEV